MKPQHQITFKPKRAGRPRAKPRDAKLAPAPHHSLDVTASRVRVGHRELQFARALSDTDKPVRDASLSSLRAWLSEHAAALSDPELDRLWKALFYCVWMADRRPVITATISAVVGLEDIVGWPFLAALFRCLVREWFGIDRHRVDKFYELVNAALAVAVHNAVVEEQHDAFLRESAQLHKVVADNVWDCASKGGLGVALHVLDVYADSIMRPVLTRAQKLPGNDVHKVYDALLDSLYNLLGNSSGHLVSVGKRIQERVLSQLTTLLCDQHLGLKVKDQRDMIARTSKRIFAIAADKSTADDVRKELYDLRVKMKAFVAEHESGDSKEPKPKKPKQPSTSENKSK